MNVPFEWIAIGAVLALRTGLLLIFGGRGMRRRLGLGRGRTVALDNVTLTSRQYGPTGLVDRPYGRGVPNASDASAPSGETSHL